MNTWKKEQKKKKVNNVRYYKKLKNLGHSRITILEHSKEDLKERGYYNIVFNELYEDLFHCVR